MSTKFRMGFLCLLALLALCAMAPEVMAVPRVPPVTNLRLVSGDSGVVKLAWDAPHLPPSAKVTIDDYIIKRDGAQIAELQGFNGIVDTTYVDGSPSTKDATYSVIAVDSSGRTSPPAPLKVPAPQSPVQPPKPGVSNPPDVIQSSDLCNAIIPPDVRGNNQPTPLETYGCGKGMNSVNDSGPDHINLLLANPTVPRPQHDFFQSVFIQLPVSLGQTFFLLISALSIWVMSASTYLATAKFFGSLLQLFNGNPVYPSLVAIAIGVGMLVLILRIFRGQQRQAYQSAAIIVAALTVLSLFLSSPIHYMGKAVELPMNLYTGIENTVTDLTSGTNVSSPRSYGINVVPTYRGNKTFNAIRKDENTDFLMFQYLPQCAVNFSDYQWVMTHNVTGTHTTWCERFVQLWGKGTRDERNHFKDQLKSANQDVYNYFTGNDQTGRVMGVVVSKSTLTLHNLMKLLVRAVVFVGEMLLLAELLFMAGWIIASMMGSDKSRLAAEQRIITMFHWLKVPSILLIIGLVEQAVEANMVSLLFNDGFFWISFISFWIELVTLIGVIVFFFKLRREHKAAMERLGAYRNASDSWSRQALKWAAAGLSAGAGAEIVRDHRGRKHQDGEAASATYGTTPSGGYDFSDYQEPPGPLLGPGSSGGSNGRPSGGPKGPSGGNGGPSYDFEGEAEEIPSLQLSRVGASKGSSNGHNHGPYDGEIYDADIVEDRPQLDSGNDFRTNGDSRF